MIIEWKADHDLKVVYKADGINSQLYFTKGTKVHIPDNYEKQIKKKLSDAIQNKYCTIAMDRKKVKYK